jgi:hypothetical protein
MSRVSSDMVLQQVGLCTLPFPQHGFCTFSSSLPWLSFIFSTASFSIYLYLASSLNSMHMISLHSSFTQFLQNIPFQVMKEVPFPLFPLALSKLSYRQ